MGNPLIGEPTLTPRLSRLPGLPGAKVSLGRAYIETGPLGPTGIRHLSADHRNCVFWYCKFSDYAAQGNAKNAIVSGYYCSTNPINSDLVRQLLSSTGFRGVYHPPL